MMFHYGLHMAIFCAEMHLDGGLSGGAIAGIVIGSIAGIGIGGSAIFSKK